MHRYACSFLLWGSISVFLSFSFALKYILPVSIPSASPCNIYRKTVQMNKKYWDRDATSIFLAKGISRVCPNHPVGFLFSDSFWVDLRVPNDPACETHRRQADGRFLEIGVPMEVLEFRITSSLILEASFLFTRLLSFKKKLRGNILLESSFDWDTPFQQKNILSSRHPEKGRTS